MSSFGRHRWHAQPAPVGGAFTTAFYNINLPSYLSFFSGRRFVPIVCGLGGLVLAAYGVRNRRRSADRTVIEQP